MKYSIVVLSLCCFFVLANKFILEEAPKKVSPSQLKQDVITLMGDLLELESQGLETSAKIQQTLCKNIRASLGGVSASRVKLTKLKSLLANESKRVIQHNAAQQRFLCALQ